jgi:hypothetical protein
MSESKARRLVIQYPDGYKRFVDDRGCPLTHFQIDLTGIANANSQSPVSAVVQEQCNLGCWHDRDSYPLAPWGTE